MSDLPDSPPIHPPLVTGYAVDTGWCDGVTILWAKSIPANDYIRLLEWEGKDAVLSPTLASKWGAHTVLVASSELADRLVKRFAPDPAAGCGYSTWRNSGHTGRSSEYMAHRLIPEAQYPVVEPAHPWDSADFRRCMVLVACTGIDPEGMRDAPAPWPSLVDRWTEIEAAINDGDRLRANRLIQEAIG